MNFVLGVDGGGTKTTARVLEVGPSGGTCVVGTGYAGGSNPLSVGWRGAEDAIRAAVSAAIEESGARPEAGVLAIAGCASPGARERLLAWARGERLAERLEVVPDTAPLLADVPAGTSAIGLIAGTGSAAVLRHPDGSTELLGGWGYLIDDAGSGYALGRDALRHAARRADARQATDRLSDALLRAAEECAPVEQVGPSRLKGLVYGSDDPRAAIARLAPIVVRLAEGGEAAADAILAVNASGLVELAAFAAARVGAGARPMVLLAGGLAQGSATYRERIVAGLAAAGWARSLVRLAPDAACACGRMALAWR